MVTAPHPLRSAMSSLRGRIMLVSIIFVVMAGAPGGVASAHAEVVDVVPTSDAVVAEAPDTVTVTFTEPVSLSGGSTEVFDDTGETVPTQGSVSGTTVTIDLPDELDDGTYVVAWRVISADSHPVSGSSVFSVGAPSTGGAVDVDVGAEVPAAASGWRVVAMAVTYAGVLAAVGLWWLTRRWYRLADVVERDDGDDVPLDDVPLDDAPLHEAAVHDAALDGGIFTALTRLDRWRVLAALTGIAGLLVALPARLVTVGGDWDALTDGTYLRESMTGPIGQATAVTVIGAAGLAVARPSRAGASTVAVGLAGSLLALGGFALEGHTRTKDPAWLLAVSDVVHTAAGSIWFGGVIALAVMLRRTAGPWRARTALDVSWWALWAVVAVAIAGLVMSMIVLRTFDALADTGYGLALLVKIGLVVVLVAIGVRNRLVLVPAIEESEMSADPAPAEWAIRGLRRAVVVELVVFAALLLATATLVGRSPVVASESPTTEHDGTGASDPVTIPLSSVAGAVTIFVDPASVGSNMVMLTLVDDDGAPLAVVEPPTVELRERSRGIGPLVLAPEDIGNSTYHAVADIPFAGTWEVTVGARTSRFDSGVATTEFVVRE